MSTVRLGTPEDSAPPVNDVVLHGMAMRPKLLEELAHESGEDSMKRIRLGRLMSATALLLLAGTESGWAGDLTIQSLAPDGRLVFRTPDAGTAEHAYWVECATSLSSAAWATVRMTVGVGGGESVTNPVTPPADVAFHRVVSTSNSASFVDGPYMIIDVSAGPTATNYPVTYYGSSVLVPYGTTSGVYKGDSILLRRIPAGTFTMGSPTNELGRESDETQHQVTLTKDFYIGVFEVTQRQWERVMGAWPSHFNNATYRDSRPVEWVSYYDIREDPTNGPISPHWPESSQVHPNSFMGKLRAKTGLTTLDLPTESQWEYACRAGTGTALNSCKNLTDIDECPSMAEVGRYWYNGGAGYTQSGDTSVATAKVGSYLPNQWGLYDMHGNVWEWCSDWYGTYPGTVTDPGGAASGSYRVLRGGSWYSNRARRCRSAYRNYNCPSRRAYSYGFRLSRTLP